VAHYPGVKGIDTLPIILDLLHLKTIQSCWSEVRIHFFGCQTHIFQWVSSFFQWLYRNIPQNRDSLDLSVCYFPKSLWSRPDRDLYARGINYSCHIMSCKKKDHLDQKSFLAFRDQTAMQ